MSALGCTKTAGKHCKINLNFAGFWRNTCTSLTNIVSFPVKSDRWMHLTSPHSELSAFYLSNEAVYLSASAAFKCLFTTLDVELANLMTTFSCYIAAVRPRRSVVAGGETCLHQIPLILLSDTWTNLRGRGEARGGQGAKMTEWGRKFWRHLSPTSLTLRSCPMRSCTVVLCETRFQDSIKPRESNAFSWKPKLLPTELIEWVRVPLFV